MTRLGNLKVVLEILEPYTDDSTDINASMGGIEFFLPQGTIISDNDRMKLSTLRCRVNPENHREVYFQV